MKISNLIEQLNNNYFSDKLFEIYLDDNVIDRQRERYLKALNEFKKNFGENDVEIYSAPGRSEIGGNHTDHQNGEVLAAAINLDAIGVVSKTADDIVRIYSDGFGEISVSISELEMKIEEKGTTRSIIKGVLKGIIDKGYKIGGFDAYITSDVLVGAGLSSSAAFEILIGTIVSGLYNSMYITPIEIAMIGQYAENEYFGKPCGLMDQMASSVGNLVHIDFANSKKSEIEKIEFDFNNSGYSLCVTDTKGSHADLTEEYAAIPREMHDVANFFGQEKLIGITKEMIFANIQKLREKTSDRAVLRAMHFIAENERVRREVKALKRGNISEFLSAVKESGDSSHKYLQNVYPMSKIYEQNITLALAIGEEVLGKDGVCRVHGGGFAGTTMAFVKNSRANEYKKYMDCVFGSGACKILNIRKYGGIKVL